MSEMTPQLAHAALTLLQQSKIKPAQIPIYKEVERALVGIAQPKPQPHPALAQASTDKAGNAER
jgi:hypothetical protein